MIMHVPRKRSKVEGVGLVNKDVSQKDGCYVLCLAAGVAASVS